jgi:triacylglycerol lipase
MTVQLAIDGGNGSALLAMQFAKIAYQPTEQDIQTQVSQITNNRWSVVWYGVDGGNQMYVAQDSVTSQFAVCIRGSVTDPETEAFWIDWFKQDLNTLGMTAWKYGAAPAGAALSWGSSDGLNSLIGLQDSTGRTVVNFLQSQNFISGKSPLTAVTGHSLGGALASAFAPYLHQQFAPGQNALDFWPITFAAPTAGNQAFADWTASQFAASAGRYFNSLDIVPHSWRDLDWIIDSFPAGPSLPIILKGLVEVDKELLKKLGDQYVQPGTGNELQGTIQIPADWFKEAGIQHGTDTYLSLLQG